MFVEYVDPVIFLQSLQWQLEMRHQVSRSFLGVKKKETLQRLGLNVAGGLDADSSAEAASFRHGFAFVA